MASATESVQQENLHALYDEVHIWHAAQGSNFIDDDEQRLGRAYLKIIQRRSRQPQLTVYEVTDALRGYRIDRASMGGWWFSHRRFTEGTTPRCVKVVLVASPPETFDRRQHFAAYDRVVPAITELLPNSWTWFLDRLRGQQLDAHLRRSKNIAASVPPPSSTPPPLSPTESQFIADLAAVVRQRADIDLARRQPNGRFAIENMAKILYTTRRTLERRLQANLGISAAAHIMRIRLDIGRELLGQGVSVKETAHRIGYTPAHMARLFTEHFQANPSSFRP